MDRLADENLRPNWAVGLAQIPGYLKTSIDDLTRLRRMHGLEALRSAKDSLLEEATSHRHAGHAQKQALTYLYGDQHESLRKANAKIGILVNRDREDCESVMRGRAESLRQDPLLDDTIKQSILAPNARARSRSPAQRRQSRSKEYAELNAPIEEHALDRYLQV